MSGATTRSTSRKGTTVRSSVTSSRAGSDSTRPSCSSAACAASKSSRAMTVSQLSTMTGSFNAPVPPILTWSSCSWEVMMLSIDSIMTSQLQEDQVSMGGTGALKLPVIVDNCETVIALELLLAAQAAELQEGLVLSEPARELVTELRTVVPFLDVDRVVAPDIAVASRFLSLHASKWFDRQKSW